MIWLFLGSYLGGYLPIGKYSIGFLVMGLIGYKWNASQAIGMGFFSLRLYDALKTRKTFSSEQVVWQIFAPPLFISGPAVISRANLILQILHFHSPFFQRAVWYLGLGLIKIYIFLPLIESYETGIILPLGLNADTLIRLLETGLYQYCRLFLEFSGYCDLAFGLCGISGIKIKRNFLRPYLATSLSEFWRRWNIGLHEFLIRHIYIPFGGNRQGLPKTCRNILICMFFVIIWHGLAPRFLIWGGMHATLLVFERYFLHTWGAKFLADSRARKIMGWVYTQSMLCFSWIIFFWP